MKPQYSKKEQELFTTLGYSDLLNQKPIVLYRMIALNMFKEGNNGILVDNIRRCLNALDRGTPYRLTEEFDDLIVDWRK